MNNLKISLNDIRACPGQRLDLRFHELVEGQNLKDPAWGDISIAATSTSVRLAGKIQATARLTCHHCLSLFFHPMEIDLDEEFVYEDYLNVKTSRGKDRELLREDFFETVPYDGTIDVSDVIYQAIVLAIPSYCICGPSCTGAPIYKGIATKQDRKSGAGGSERPSTIDPRWHNLKTIFSNDTQNKKVRDNS